MDWQVKNQLPQSYGFQYDALNRIKAAKHATGNYIANDAFGVNNISYDKNGNILSLQRHGIPQNVDDCYAIIDDLAYAYTGNQLTGVTELGDTEKGFWGSDGGYTYDANGNLQFDGNRYATFDLYNHLNLPAAYVKYGAGYLEWDYDANGTKLQKRTFDNSSVAPGVALSDFAATPADETRDYLNGIEYVNNQLEAIYHEEGRIIKNNGNFEWQWILKDHLDNTRLLFADGNNDGSIDANSELLSIQNYYPFGMQFEGNFSQNQGRENNYLFNGMELQKEFGLGLYLTKYRAYDPAIGRFWQIDALADEALSWTPFRFAFNNPLIYTDPDGLFETRKAAKQYAKDNDMRTGWFSGNKIRKQEDGSFAITNRQIMGTDAMMVSETFITDMGGDIGVVTGTTVTPEDVVGRDDSFFTMGFVKRDGSTMKFDRPSLGFPAGGAAVKGSVSVLSGGFNFFSKLKKAFGPLKNWVRGPKGSYSKSLGKKTQKSISWGASPAKKGKYAKQIGNPFLRRINQWLRGKRLPPGKKSWRTKDSGHIHLDKTKPK